ncbi:hypothetical protein ES703_83181 [subsurface metagenome]
MKENIKSYKDLQVWQEAMELVASIYRVAKRSRVGLAPPLTYAKL